MKVAFDSSVHFVDNTLYFHLIIFFIAGFLLVIDSFYTVLVLLNLCFILHFMVFMLQYFTHVYCTSVHLKASEILLVSEKLKTCVFDLVFALFVMVK